MQADVKHSKQTTLGCIQEKIQNQQEPKPELRKQIEINEIAMSTREDELTVKVSFRLSPSRTSFSKVSADLCFDGERVDSLRLWVLQGPLASDVLEFSSVLEMTGITAGQHALRVDMYESWDSGERLSCASKEVSVEYVPVKREDRLVKVPFVKNSAGADLAIVSDSEKRVYRELEEEMKEEEQSRRDRW